MSYYLRELIGNWKIGNANTFASKLGSIVVDENTLTVSVHDGVTLGGLPLAAGVAVVGPVINITGSPYNADSTGSSDSTAAFTAAIAAALLTGVQTTIYVPSGCYIVSETISITIAENEGIYLRGEAASCVTIKQTADADCFDVSLTNYGGNFATGAFRISGIRFQMAATSTTRNALSITTTASSGAVGVPLIIDDLTFASPSSTSYWGTEIYIDEIPNDVIITRISGLYSGNGMGTHLSINGNSTSYTTNVFGRDLFFVGGTNGVVLGNYLQGIHFSNLNTLNTPIAVTTTPTAGVNEEIQIADSALEGQIVFSTAGTLNSVKITNSYLYTGTFVPIDEVHVTFANVPIVNLNGNTFNGPATRVAGITGLSINGASTYNTTCSNNIFQAYLNGGLAIRLGITSSNLLFTGSVFLNNTTNLSDSGTNNVFASSMENATFYAFGLSEQVSVAPNVALFGTGVNGNVTISAGTTTLTHDMNYSNLTLNGTGTLNTAGFRVFVANTLDISAAQTGAIICNGIAGNSASGTTNGAATSTIDLNTASMPWSTIAGAVGGISAATTGGNGGNGTGAIVSLGGTAPAAGNGGAGSNSGGLGGTISNAVLSAFPSNGFPAITPIGYWSSSTRTIYVPGLSGPGGGAGGGDGTHFGGGGGGGAYGAGFIVICARIIARGTNSNTSIIQTKGQTGGSGGTPITGTNCGGGGGGAGSGGGFVWILAGVMTGSQIADAVDVSGGNAGNGGNGFGSGDGGLICNGSNSGAYQLNVLNPASATLVLSTQTGAAGTGPSGSTGGTGGLGAVSQGAL